MRGCCISVKTQYYFTAFNFQNVGRGAYIRIMQVIFTFQDLWFSSHTFLKPMCVVNFIFKPVIFNETSDLR